jgi:hypothetical protein
MNVPRGLARRVPADQNVKMRGAGSVSYHLRAKQLPGCFFPPDAERTYDRSFRHFAELVMSKKI